MRGIVLAGGAGTRLHPITRAISKQLVPVYDKPMVYYPISVLLQAGIRDILLITTPTEQSAFRALLGDGAQWGVNFTYAEQLRPEGIAQALVIARDFLQGGACALILGDNLFFGADLSQCLRRARTHADGATIFAFEVKDPQRYGVVHIDAAGHALEIVEKPVHPASKWAVTGLYLYDAEAPAIAAGLKPSERGEYEITALNNVYLKRGNLRVERLGRGYAWLDTGTPDSLLEAAEFVRAIEHRQGLQIACLEEIAFECDFIDEAQLGELASRAPPNTYGDYVRSIASRLRRT